MFGDGSSVRDPEAEKPCSSMISLIKSHESDCNQSFHISETTHPTYYRIHYREKVTLHRCTDIIIILKQK